MAKKLKGATVRKFGKHMSKADDLVVFRTTIEGVMHQLQGDAALEKKTQELMSGVVSRQLSHIMAAFGAVKEAREVASVRGRGKGR